MKVKLALISLLAALSLNAGEIQVTKTAVLDSGGFSVKLDKFNKNIGNLTNVVVSTSGFVSGDIVLNNPNVFDVTGQAGASATFVTTQKLKGKNERIISVDYGYSVGVITLAAGETVSRPYQLGFSSVDTVSDVNSFIGNNTVTFNMSVRPFPYAYGLPLGGLQNITAGEGTVTVTYQFE